MIGNEGSAFVEILVARSSSDNEDYKVTLHLMYIILYEFFVMGTHAHLHRFCNE